MATGVMPASTNQSDKARRSTVIVPNSLSSMTPSACRPVGSGVTRHAITVFFCTSNPAPWVKITSMGHLRVRRGWRDTQMSSVYVACSTSRRKLATIHGAYRYPGPTVVQARGTNSKSTSLPAQVDAFYTDGRAQGHL
jgi:hypothetical protein